MANGNKNLFRFSNSLLLTLGMFVVTAITFSFYVYSEKQIDHANELRFQSFLLADELRQSSDDLSRMVRSYVITGNPIYKQHYQEILDIRDGKIPRPIDYSNIYWDLVLNDSQRPSANGQAIVLLDLMRQANFTATEFNKLKQAKANSDALTDVEFEAISLIEETSPVSEKNRQKAIDLVFGTAYHQAKAEIMRPIREFYQMVDERTFAAVHTAMRFATLIRIVFISFSLLLVFTLWLTYRTLYITLGCSVKTLQEYIMRLGSGDFLSSIPVAKGMENSVLAWLSETQMNLARLEIERKQAETELKQYQSHLENLVAERTEQLLKAKEIAETANIAKSTFIATMSHELRTPLNAILGFSELMSQDATISTNQKQTLSIINRSGIHLLSMINDVLDISKIEAGRLELTIQAFDLKQLLRDIGDMFSVRAANKQLNFQLKTAPDLIQYIWGDSGKLRQVLINLLGNAIKFTQYGGVTLRAYSEPYTMPTTVLLIIEIIDTGEGIATDKLDDLFKPFVQLTRKESNLEGTGLGLAISKSLIELMSGKISVKSAVDEGSTFKIALPVPIATEDDLNTQQDWLPVKGLAPNQPEWRLLIVDDILDNRLLLVKMLTSVGFQVREAENGLEAVTLFQQWQPHLIWMDMRMPMMDGYTATAKIRQLPNGDSVKIVAITASAFKEQHDSMIQAGCDKVLHKPVQSTEVFSTLASLLAVQFIYQDLPKVQPSINLTANIQLFQHLPSELRQQLHDAAENLDIEETQALIAKIQAIAPEIADTVQTLAEHYQFEQIIQLTELENHR